MSQNKTRNIILVRRGNSRISSWAYPFYEFAGENWAFESCEDWLTSPKNFTKTELGRVQCLLSGFNRVLAFGLGMGSALPEGTKGAIYAYDLPENPVPKMPKGVLILANCAELAIKLRSKYPYNKVQVLPLWVPELLTGAPNFEELSIFVFGDDKDGTFKKQLAESAKIRGIAIGFGNCDDSTIIVDLRSDSTLAFELLDLGSSQRPLILMPEVAKTLGLRHNQDCVVIQSKESSVDTVIGCLMLPLTLQGLGSAGRATIQENFAKETQMPKLLEIVFDQ